MDADALRALQAPLKAKYREAPDAAVITLRADGELGEGDLLLGGDRPRASPRPACTRPPAATAMALLGRHAARGARGLRRGDAAGGRDRRSEIPLASGTVARRGRPRLPRHPRRSTARRRSASARSGSTSTSTPTPTQEQLDTLLKLTERYCVVFQTINAKPQLTVKMNRG